MLKVSVSLPNSPIPATDPLGIAQWLGYLVTSANNLLGLICTRLNAVLPKDGSEAMTGPLPLATYTTATRPTPTATLAGTVIYVSNGGAGNVFQGCNGSSWVSLG